jgi:serine/threonine-protein kinase
LLDKYRVLRELGSGGMSVVLLAEHASLGTKVAIKLLLPALARLPDAPARFVREAQAATRIDSEHVARVIDVGTLPGGEPYMIMEYLEGRDLGRYIKEGKRFSVPEAIDYVVQACDALARGHVAGVIHRDVKPSNLFLTRRPDGSPLIKVLDFGISKVVQEAANDNLELTRTNAIMGSALYMSLEQMRSTKTVDLRTDVWALGVSLYELFAGSHPYTAETFSELCVKVSLDPPEPLRKHRPDIPQALAAAIEIAYARDAAERYQTVGSFAAALSPWATPETRARIKAIQRFEREAYPGGKIPERRRPPRPRPAWAVYGAVAAAGVAASGVLWVAMDPVPSQHGKGHLVVDASAVDAGAVVVESAPLLPVSAPVEPASAPDAGAIDAGAVDAGADGGKPRAPCKPGEMILLPNGLRRPCGL